VRIDWILVSLLRLEDPWIWTRYKYAEADLQPHLAWRAVSLSLKAAHA